MRLVPSRILDRIPKISKTSLKSNFWVFFLYLPATEIFHLSVKLEYLVRAKIFFSIEDIYFYPLKSKFYQN